MPLLAHGIDHTALDRSPTGPADGDTHLVMAGQTVELPLELPGISSQLLTAEAEGNNTRSVWVAEKKCRTCKYIPQFLIKTR